MSEALIVALAKAIFESAVRAFEKVGEQKASAAQLEALRFESKLQAQLLIGEHAGDLTLALKQKARKKFGGR